MSLCAGLFTEITLKPASFYPSATFIVEHQPVKFCLLARANVRVVFAQKHFSYKDVL